MGKYSQDPRILILTEDYYGKPFFKKLISRLKREKIIPTTTSIDAKWFPGKCNTKLYRIINATVAPFSERIGNIIIVADAEGEDIDLAIKQLKMHIPSNAEKIVHYIIFDYCIEEWICEGLGIKVKGSPLEQLKNYMRRTKNIDYEKHMLPEFAEKIDLSLLMNNKKFREFINILTK